MPRNSFNFQPYVNPYVKLPVEEYRNLQEELRGTYDQTANTFDFIEEANKAMQALSPDEELKKQLQEKYRGIINQAAEKGDYENMSRIARRTAKEFASEYRPIQEQLQRRQQYQEELSKNKDILEEDKRQALGYSDYLYEKQKGLQGGSYSGFNPSKYVDIGKKLSDFGKQFNADKRNLESGWVFDESTGTLVNRITKQEIVNPQEVQNALLKYAVNDPETMSYLKDKTLLSNFRDIESLSDEDKSKFLNKRMLDNLLGVSSAVADREGYSDLSVETKLHNLSDSILNKTLNPAETIDSQVMPSRVDLQELDVADPSKYNLDTFLANKGITRKVVDVGGSSVTQYYKDGKLMDSEMFTEPSEVQQVRQEIKNLQNSKDTYKTLEYLSQNNPELKGVFEQTKNELKGKSNSEIARITQDRYNSKKKGIATSKESIVVPNKSYQETMQSQLFGTSSGTGDKATSGVGDIINRNIYDETTGEMLSFSDWASRNDVDLNKLAKEARFTGDVLGKRGVGEHAFTYNGKTYYVSGSRERQALVRPIRDAFSVVTENKSSTEPIDFSESLKLPGLVGISLAGKYKNGKFIPGDSYNKDNQWESREPVIQLTEDFHEHKAGSYISWDDIMEAYKEANKIHFGKRK